MVPFTYEYFSMELNGKREEVTSTKAKDYVPGETCMYIC